MNKIIDLTGQRFGHLTVVCFKERKYKGKNNSTSYLLWECKCDCGNVVVRSSEQLRLYNRKYPAHCGCKQSDYLKQSWLEHPELRDAFSKRAITHNMSNSTTYKSWQSCIQKCTNPTHRSYRFYGGAGIRVCKRWMISFEAFLEDMGERPSGTCLCRIDVAKDFSKENCVWGCHQEQLKKRKFPVEPQEKHFIYDGVDYTIRSFCKHFNISFNSIVRQRVHYWLRHNKDLGDFIKQYSN